MTYINGSDELLAEFDDNANKWITLREELNELNWLLSIEIKLECHKDLKMRYIRTLSRIDEISYKLYQNVLKWFKGIVLKRDEDVFNKRYLELEDRSKIPPVMIRELVYRTLSTELNNFN